MKLLKIPSGASEPSGNSDNSVMLVIIVTIVISNGGNSDNAVTNSDWCDTASNGCC